MTPRTGSTTDASAPSKTVDPKDLWDRVLPILGNIVATARAEAAWRKAHPGSSAHLTLVRATAKARVLAALAPLHDFLAAHAPAHCSVAGWGFKVLSTLNKAHWADNQGRASAGPRNHGISLTNPHALAAFTGRVLAAFGLARTTDTTRTPRGWYGFTLPFVKPDGMTPDTTGPWRRVSAVAQGFGGMDAFATAVLLGLLTRWPARNKDPAISFHKAYRAVHLMARQAVPTSAPRLAGAILAHPKAKALMHALVQDDPSRSLSVFQYTVLHRASLLADPLLLSKAEARRDSRALEQALDDLLARLDRLAAPPERGQWVCWHMEGVHRTNVWAWDLESAAVIAALDSLQMVEDYTPPQAYLDTARAKVAAVA